MIIRSCDEISIWTFVFQHWRYDGKISTRVIENDEKSWFDVFYFDLCGISRHYLDNTDSKKLKR